MSYVKLLLAEPWVHAGFWSAATIGFYAASKRWYQRWPCVWLMPLGLAPALLIGLSLCLHESYQAYISGTFWLVRLLGPATVAFAIPIYEKRALIARHWQVLVIGTLVGATTGVLTAWGFATLLGLDASLRLSLLPRSISTPFAMAVSETLGGVPELTAAFVIVTGLCGAAFGEALLVWLPIRSSLARGALFGAAAHGAGTAKAYEIGREEGSIASLVMMMSGVFSVLIAPLLVHVLPR
jgi:predicted murein hydrolase (TIGR00659 family)